MSVGVGFDFVEILKRQNTGKTVYGSDDLTNIIEQNTSFYDVGEVDTMKYESITNTDITMEVQLTHDDEFSDFRVYPTDMIFFLDPRFWASDQGVPYYAYSPFTLNDLLRKMHKKIVSEGELDQAVEFCKRCRKGAFNVFGYLPNRKRIEDWESKKHYLFIDPFAVVEMFQFRGVIISYNGKYTEHNETMYDTQLNKKFRFDDDLVVLESSALEMDDVETRAPISNRHLKEGLRISAYLDQKVDIFDYRQNTNPENMLVSMIMEAGEQHLMKFVDGLGFVRDPRPGWIIGSVGHYETSYDYLEFDSKYNKITKTLQDFSRDEGRNGFINYITKSSKIKINLQI